MSRSRRETSSCVPSRFLTRPSSTNTFPSEGSKTSRLGTSLSSSPSGFRGRRLSRLSAPSSVIPLYPLFSAVLKIPDASASCISTQSSVTSIASSTGTRTSTVSPPTSEPGGNDPLGDSPVQSSAKNSLPHIVLTIMSNSYLFWNQQDATTTSSPVKSTAGATSP